MVGFLSKYLLHFLLFLLFLFCSILKEHCEIKNEESKKITIKAIGDARVLVNGEAVDDNEEEELHHLDRYILFCLFYHSYY